MSPVQSRGPNSVCFTVSLICPGWLHTGNPPTSTFYFREYSVRFQVLEAGMLQAVSGLGVPVGVGWAWQFEDALALRAVRHLAYLTRDPPTMTSGELKSLVLWQAWRDRIPQTQNSGVLGWLQQGQQPPGKMLCKSTFELCIWLGVEWGGEAKVGAPEARFGEENRVGAVPTALTEAEALMGWRDVEIGVLGEGREGKRGTVPSRQRI